MTRYSDRGTSYYIVSDNGGITSGTGCVPVRGVPTMAACRVTAGLKRYEIRTGAGDHSVRFNGILSTAPGDTTGGTADLGAGNDRFSGLGSGSAASDAGGAPTRCAAGPASTS